MAGLLDFLTVAGNISNPIGTMQRGLLGQIAPPILDYFKNQPQAPQFDSMYGLAGSEPVMPSQPPVAAPYPQGTDPMTAGGVPSAPASITAPQAAPLSQGLPNPIAVGNYQMPRVGNPDQFQPQQVNTPPNAQPTQGQLPQESPSFFDRMNAGFQSIGNGGSVIGALTGKLTDQPSQTQRFLVARGLDPELARTISTNPHLLQAVLPQIIGGKPPETKEFETSSGGKVAMQWNPQKRAWEKVPGVEGAAAGKPPSGYVWKDPSDPSKGLEAIAGGPATHLPAETAGRIAMMETAAADLPNARKTLMKERGPTGVPLGTAAASVANVGEYARANRTIRLAIEGALRAMTGAAAPETEVKRYENLFAPSPFDAPETAKQKLDQLDDFISNAGRLVRQGRGPAGEAGMQIGQSRTMGDVTMKRVK